MDNKMIRFGFVVLTICQVIALTASATDGRDAISANNLGQKEGQGDWVSFIPPWDGRDYFESTVFDGKMWIIGGTSSGSEKNDVWWSADGAAWNLATQSAAWSARSGHTSVVYDGKMWVMGGHDGSSNKSDVWWSEDGVTWNEATWNAPWSPRSSHTSVVFDDKMWIIGGSSTNDVWWSEDGATWTEATGSAAWSTRSGHTSVAFDGKLWVIGGYGSFPSTHKNDVWWSEDGATWWQAAGSADWRARVGHASVVFDDKMWVIGGGTEGYGLENDVWWSEDGATWWQAAGLADWRARQGHASVVFDDKMWVMGGQGNIGGPKNDVWWSADGATWYQTAESAWPARTGHTCVSFDNKVWVIGGSSWSDVWWSGDGAVWTRSTQTAAWPARSGHTSVVFDNKMWVIGGDDGSGRKNDVWWSTDGTVWISATGGAAWSVRYEHTSVVFDGKMWVIGGQDGFDFKNDVWWSDDGVTWNEATADAAWDGRSYHTSVVLGGKMWVMGGQNSHGHFNDVWWSEDGATWTQETGTVSWPARFGHTSVTFNDTIWVIGGCCDGYMNDVWAMSPAPAAAPFVYGPPAPTADQTPTWTWLSRGGGGNGVFRFKLDDADLSVGATETSGHEFTPDTSLDDGPHTLYVQEGSLRGDWSVSGSLSVIVDNAPPVAVCGPWTVTLEGLGLGTLNPADLDGGSYDPAGSPLTFGASRTRFTCADLGENTVTLLVTDAVGLTDTCEAQVTVVGDCFSEDGYAPGSGDTSYAPHSSDYNSQDWNIRLTELLRGIQFYNAGGLQCNYEGTEDGYAPGLGDTSCAPHSSDYNPQDWRIDASELLRLIQFYNSVGYHCATGEETPSPAPEFTLTRSVFPEDGYQPGQELSVDVTIDRTSVAPITALAVEETLPEGWTFASAWNHQISPVPGASGTLNFIWFTIPVFPCSFSYTVNVPAEADGAYEIAGRVIGRSDGPEATSPSVSTILLPTGGGEGEGEGEGGDPVVPGEMVWVPAGSFEMGRDETGPYLLHTVHLSGYEIGRYEVTNQEYADVLNWAKAAGKFTYAGGNVTAYGQTILLLTESACQISYSGEQFVVEERDDHSMSNHPVVTVTWFGSASYCNWLSERDGFEPCYNTANWVCDFTKNGYHLPTEAQWERAAAWEPVQQRRYDYGNSSDNISCVSANYNPSPNPYCNPIGLSDEPYTSPVGYYADASSPAGCFDMSGNVWEFCNDWFSTDYYGSSPDTDPAGPATGTFHVQRSGSWSNGDCRSSSRMGAFMPPDNPSKGLGFRIARSVIAAEGEGEGEGGGEGEGEGEPPVYTFTADVIGSGSVTPESGSTYAVDSLIVVTASPALNWVFDYWEGDLAGVPDNPAALVMNGDRSVTAVFRPAGPRIIRGTVTNSITGNPVEGVYVEVSAAVTKALSFATTDGSGQYQMTVPEDTGAVTMTFSCREYLPQILDFAQPPSTPVDVALVPVGVTTPRKPIANSGPKTVFVEWDANPEYNLKGYYVWRTPTDASGVPTGDAVRVSGLIGSPEYQDAATGPGEHYVYQVQALSGGDRPSALSPASDPVKAQYLTVFLPDITLDTGVESLYLWDLTPEIIEDRLWVRIPVSVRSAYEVSSAAMDIVADLPTSLLDVTAAADVRVEATGITAGMEVAHNVPVAGELRISASDLAARSLYGSGVLFDLLVPRKSVTDCGLMALVEDTFDGSSGREGVRLYDDGNPPQPVPLELENGTLCTTGGPCLHGDVNEDGLIDELDVRRILALKVGLFAHTECSRWAGDVNLDGRVDSADALMLQRWLAGLPINPPGGKAGGMVALSFALGVEKSSLQPEVWVGTAQGSPNALINVPVTIASAAPMAGFSMTVNFLSGTEGLVFQSASLGGGLAGAFELRTKNNTEGDYGSLSLAASGASPIGTNAATELVMLTFRVGASAPAGTPLPLVLESFDASDQFGLTPRHGAPGQPLIVLTPSGAADIALLLLEGFAGYDANGDGRLSLAEAAASGLKQDAFDAMDANGDGALQVSELLEATGGEGAVHRADVNADGGITLSELLRAIQFYNSGGYHCAENGGATEDGFVPGPGGTSCIPHTSDYYPQDWLISLSELLRAIQFYNSGGYHYCPGDGTEDGFCPGPA